MRQLFLGLLAMFCALGSTQAKMVEMPALNFSVNYKALKSGEIHYAFSLIKPNQLPLELALLDDVEPSNGPDDARILYSKVAYIVNKPVQHFNYQNVININELKRLRPNAALSQLSERSFKVKVEGLLGHEYKLDLEYDSEIVSTVNDSAIIEAIDRARRLDATLGQANSTIYRRLHDFTKYRSDGVSITRHYDLDGEATLVVTTDLSSVKTDVALENILRPTFLNETKQTVELIRQ